ncbi:MAG TPA: hypothetical protein VFH25_04480 [Nitrososphaeraceae archaeon]|nr:hypothetical protein [Nitrososphaeraceae archaeon]
MVKPPTYFRNPSPSDFFLHMIKGGLKVLKERGIKITLRGKLRAPLLYSL